jgi:uncharacterized protein
MQTMHAKVILDHRHFRRHVLQNAHNAAILARWDALNLPNAWLVAGCLFQTVWNLRSGQAAEASIKDYDLFYFDGANLGEEAEQAQQRRIAALFADLGIEVEASNQARVHLWYPRHFGNPYPPLTCTQEGIDRFLVPATCVGITPSEVYAPHGLEPLYEGQLAMNPLVPYRALFEAKTTSYRSRWPWLRVLHN